MINRIIAELFDMGSAAVRARQRVTAPKMPDLSGKSVDHLLSPEEKNDPAVFYAPSGRRPRFTAVKETDLLFMKIVDGKFRSPVETTFEENNTVYTRHYQLAKNGPGGPTVVIIMGLYLDDYTYLDWWCWRFAAWGLNSILFDIPYHYRRAPKGCFSGQLMLIGDTAWTLVSLKQSYRDTEALVNLLRGWGAGPIGTFGVSFGAALAGIFVCQADTADFAVMGMPPVDASETLREMDFAADLEKLEARGQQTLLTDPVLPRIFNLSEMAPKVPNSNIFIGYGEYDHLVPAESVERTAAKWGGLPWLMKYPAGHINTFVLNPRFILDAEKFFKRQILK